MSGWGRHGLCHQEAYSPVFRDMYHLQKLTNNCGITAVKLKCFQGGGTWDHEIQIMKNFGYWALYLINSTTPTSFARVSKAGKCHLPGLFNDSKKLQENKTSHCLWKERKGTTLLTGHRLCEFFSWTQAQNGLTWKDPGTGNRRNSQENNVGDNCAHHGQLGIYPSHLIFSYTLLEAGGRAAMARNHTNLPDLAVVERLPASKTPVLQLVQAFLTEDRVVEIKCLQSHGFKFYQQRGLGKLH